MKQENLSVIPLTVAYMQCSGPGRMRTADEGSLRRKTTGRIVSLPGMTGASSRGYVMPTSSHFLRINMCSFWAMSSAP